MTPMAIGVSYALRAACGFVLIADNMGKRDLPLGLFAWCFVIFVASFMPWATGPVLFPFFGSISAIATGWTGNVNFLGIVIPNWVAVVLAAALAAIGWMRANAVDVDPKTSYWLALGGVVHSAFFLFSVLGGGGRIGLGSLATLVAFIAILRQFKRRPVAPPVFEESADSYR